MDATFAGCHQNKAFLFEEARGTQTSGQGKHTRILLEGFSYYAASLASRAGFLFVLPWSRNIFREGARLSSPELTALRQESSPH